MRLIRFLSLLEKIIIALIILCFIPTALFAYLPRPIPIPNELQSAYQNVVEQASHSGFLTTTASGDNCSSKYALAVSNELCLDRCVFGSNCSILLAGQPCPYSYNYVVGQVKVCSAAPVLNKLIPADTVSFEPDHQALPLDRAQMDPHMHLLFEPYCLANLNLCRQLIDQFGRENLEGRFSDNYSTFSVLVQYLMFFGLLPLIVHTVVVFLLDSCGKFNLRMTNSLMIIHEALIGAAIIIAGISFNLQNDGLQSSINKFSSTCLIHNDQCQQTYLPFSTFTANDGVSSTFVTVMCFVLAVEALLLVGVVVLNVLMVKYYKLRELEPSFSGYELQTL